MAHVIYLFNYLNKYLFVSAMGHCACVSCSESYSRYCDFCLAHLTLATGMFQLHSSNITYYFVVFGYTFSCIGLGRFYKLSSRAACFVLLCENTHFQVKGDDRVCM
jgi:hypothetical protein